MRLKQLMVCGALAVIVGGCENTSSTRSSGRHVHETTPPAGVHQSTDSLDKRIPVPLLPHMAQHQRANMREHLAAIQEILAALSTNNFPAVERATLRIGYTEEMAQMCEHMGAGAAGFTDMAIHFHRTADTIGAAAKLRDADAALKAVASTLQTCIGCHATYQQQIVDEATWERAISRGKTSKPQ